MRIDVHDESRQLLFREAVDPPASHVRDVELRWEGAIDGDGYLRLCPVCGCRELFVRKDFPQKFGLTMVVIAAAAALVLFTMGQVIAAFAVLGAMAVIDAVVYLLTPRCLVCYRCRSEFRDTPIAADHEPWELATGEKYRQLLNPDADNADGQDHGRPRDTD